MSFVLAATGFSHEEITSLFLALGVMLALARIMGELARKLRQPAVLGEILAGILLGPTVLGALSPDVAVWLFAEADTTNFQVLEFLFLLSAALLLLTTAGKVALITMTAATTPAIIRRLVIITLSMTDLLQDRCDSRTAPLVG